MNHRKFLKTLSRNLAAMSLTPPFCCTPRRNSRPNTMRIIVDNLGCDGSTFYETPNIDRLAADGLRFTNAYSPCPVCSPTWAALLFGKSPAMLSSLPASRWE